MADVRIPEMMDVDGSSDWTVVTWLFADGSMVGEREIICEVMADKAVVEIEAEAAGRLEIVEAADAVVKTGDLIGRIIT